MKKVKSIIEATCIGVGLITVVSLALVGLAAVCDGYLDESGDEADIEDEEDEPAMFDD